MTSSIADLKDPYIVITAVMALSVAGNIISF
jgi:hypothetical protein